MRILSLFFCEFMHNYKKNYATFNVTQQKSPTLAAKDLIYKILTACYVKAVS